LISSLGKLYATSAASSDGFLMNLYDFMATTALVVCLMSALVYQESTAMDMKLVHIFVLNSFCRLLQCFRLLFA